MSDLLESLRLACDDPMWADHVEMPKKLLRHAIDRLDSLSAELETVKGDNVRLECQVDELSEQLRNYERDPVGLHWKRRAEAAEAKLAGGEAVKVKPLEWWVADTGDTIADSIVGRYRLGKVSANANFRLETPSGLIEKPSPEYYWPKDEAKAAAQADYERRILSALTHPVPTHNDGSGGAVKATHRHKKRGSEYALLGIGKMQAEFWAEPQGYDPAAWPSIDMREVAIYRSVDDGSLWVRPREEFEDGRFEDLRGEAS